MMNNNNFEHIPQEKFEFVQLNSRLHDKKLETKSRSFFQDALIRFRKNKSSVFATWILAFLLLYTIIAPLISPYTLENKDKLFVNFPAYIPYCAENDWGLWDGTTTMDNQNENQVNKWAGIAKETGLDPVVEVVGSHSYTVRDKGKDVVKYRKDLRINRYFEKGIEIMVLTYDEYEALQNWQTESGIQVIYPWVDSKAVGAEVPDADYWYKTDKNGNAKLDKQGNFQPVYCTDSSKEAAPYHSTRIAGDDGSYIYSFASSGAVSVRVCYYNYYRYINGTEPFYIFGTTSMGQDLFSAIGYGARFSLIFAILVSAVNLSLGAVYGAIQGYYGGKIDLYMDRLSDILSGIPMVVVITLFQLHLGADMSPVGAFLLAFIVTGWIGMAALTRKQFYRYKSQEFVMAARTLGASDKRLMFKHIFPNAIGTIITSCALVIPGVIRSETTMTYLGIVDLEAVAGTTVGTLLSQGQGSFVNAPHTMLWPSIFMGLLMISFNLFGNGLRDAFNPTTRGAGD